MVEPKVVVPDHFAVMPQIQPEDVRALADQGYRAIINNRPDNEKPDQPEADEIRSEAGKNGLHYEHMPVTVDSITREDVDAFRQAVTLASHPVVAHCATGRRSFLLWAAGEVLDGDRSVDDLLEQADRVGLDGKELPRIIDRIQQSDV